jgi:CD81 antigen
VNSHSGENLGQLFFPQALGIAGIVFAVWMLVAPSFSLSLTQDYVISVIIILIASILLVVVAIFGILGSLKESQCALTTFFCLLLIIVVAEVSAGVWIHINSDSLKHQIEKAVELTVDQEYHQDESRRQLFDTFQQKLHCCGAKSAGDWIGKKQVVVSVTSRPDNYTIPMSCCREDASIEECMKATREVKPAGAVDYTVIYQDGCYNALLSIGKEYSCWILIFGIVIAVIQVLGLIFALILAFAVNRSNRYKG